MTSSLTFRVTNQRGMVLGFVTPDFGGRSHARQSVGKVISVNHILANVATKLNLHL